MKTNILKRWLTAATPKQRGQLARLAGTSVGNLRQLAGAYRTKGRLNVSPELARRLELASKQITGEIMPPLWRTDLCPACGRCEFAKRCGQ